MIPGLAQQIFFWMALGPSLQVLAIHRGWKDAHFNLNNCLFVILLILFSTNLRLSALGPFGFGSGPFERPNSGTYVRKTQEASITRFPQAPVAPYRAIRPGPIGSALKNDFGEGRRILPKVEMFFRFQRFETDMLDLEP